MKNLTLSILVIFSFSSKAEPTYELVKSNIGEGKHSIVSLVRNVHDESLWAWKQAKNREGTEAFEDDLRSYRDQIERSQAWGDLDISYVKTFWHEDRKSILATYIEGQTLKEIQQENPKFFESKKTKKMLKRLANLIVKASQSGLYIGDINQKNIIWDGSDWVVVDSGSVKDVGSVSNAFNEYIEKLSYKWTKSIPGKIENIAAIRFFGGIQLSKIPSCKGVIIK